jgi:ABC-type Zn uptake system ZnuABC Zn-binding protein ZnuA
VSAEANNLPTDQLSPKQVTRIDKDKKDAQNKRIFDIRIFDMWLDCYTQEEIAEAVGCDKGTVSKFVENSFTEPNSTNPTATHLRMLEKIT